jgi:hypothetical protein
MKQIKRFFNWEKDAVKFRNRLYNKYNSVNLVSSPLFNRAGFYVWQVDGQFSNLRIKESE